MTDALDRLKAALADRYRIERELGRGGMATVFLAQDLKHHRSVAIKVLRPELAAALGPERFLSEIATVARLTHPHIVPLHDSGQADGFLYYTMPFVEGESLRDRLTREHQLPLDEALRITREVADALSYAHALGLVHRDIKPENILLESGHAVVADFGIARAIVAAGTEQLTETGIAVGTPAYMSPEQAAGSKDVDGRSDLYGLGCVLYEMLSGEPPYTGPTPQAILAKKLSAPLPRISVVREAVPPGIEAALTKALARTPADRYVTAAEFAAALALPDAMVTPSGGTAPSLLATARGRWPRWAKWGAAFTTVAVAALAASELVKLKPLNITVSDMMPVTSEPGVEFEPAISPDGNDVAYVAGPIGLPRLFVRSTANLAGANAVRLGDTAEGSEWTPSWSPDGQLVRFWGCPGRGGSGAASCEWRETGKLGGAARPAAVPSGTRNRDRLARSLDGARVAFVSRDTIFTSSVGDTGAHPIAVAGDAHSLAWSPDGRLLAYVSGNDWWVYGGNVAGASIWIVDAGGGTPRQVVSDEHLNASPTWLDARHLLFVSDRDVLRGAYVVEVGSNGPRGAPRAIPGVGDPHSISYSIGAHKLAYAKFTVRQNVWSYPLSGPTAVSIKDGQPVTAGDQTIEESDVSRDGRWLAFDSNRRGNQLVYKMPLAGGDAVPVAAQGVEEMEHPRWSPDGREIAFMANVVGGGIRIMVVPADGGVPTALTDDSSVNVNPVFSPSGLTIAFWRARKGPYRIWLVSRDSVGGRWHEPVQLTDFDCGLPVWVPDGRGVLCGSGGDLIIVSPQGRILWRSNLLTSSGLTRRSARFRYSRDGRTIFVSGRHEDGRHGIWAIPVAGGAPRLVVAFDDPVLDNPLGLFNVGPDHLYVTVADYESDIWVANLHW